MLELDRHYLQKAELITGIDEAGRGPLAGPLVVAGVTLRSDVSIAGLNDSKKLSDKKRRELFEQLPQIVSASKIVIVGVEEIERLNILGATMWGMRRVWEELSERGITLVDGNRLPEGLSGSGAEAVVKGDQKVSAIAAASILAKVTRDNIMLELDKEYPGYGFARNKGYGTREHLAAIDKLGITPHHRLSYAPVAQYTIQF